MNKLETSFAGLKLKNPLIVSSSGLTNSVERNKRWEEAGAAAVVLKSLFEEQIMMESARMQKSNGYGEENEYLMTYYRGHCLNEYIELLRGTKEQCSIPVIASINCYSDAEWTDFAHTLEEAGADAIELNIMAIQSEIDYAYGSFEQRHIDILRKVKAVVDIPVIVKLGSRFTNCIPLIDQLYANGVAAVVLFNRMASPDIQINTMTYTTGEVLGNPSDISEVIRWIGLASARIPSLNLIASGGVGDGAALVKVILAGAQAAEVCSTLYRHGASQVQSMLYFMESWMEEHGYESIVQFKGRMNATGMEDETVFERTQFFKYFSQKEPY